MPTAPLTVALKSGLIVRGEPVQFSDADADLMESHATALRTLTGREGKIFVVRNAKIYSGSQLFTTDVTAYHIEDIQMILGQEFSTHESPEAP